MIAGLMTIEFHLEGCSSLKEKRKLFCKKCLNPYQMPSIRIKNDKLTISCENCEYKSRWKIA